MTVKSCPSTIPYIDTGQQCWSGSLTGAIQNDDNADDFIGQNKMIFLIGLNKKQIDWDWS